MKQTLKSGVRLRSRALLSVCLATAVGIANQGCASLPVVVTADQLCKDWIHQTVSKSDQITQQTASNMEASNKSRPAWGCEYGKNNASG